jgi:hypothetical protein
MTMLLKTFAWGGGWCLAILLVLDVMRDKCPLLVG